MYEVLLPWEVQEFLRNIQFSLSFGIEGIPLACVGADGFISRLTFWMVLPVVLVAIVSSLRVVRVLCIFGHQVTRTALLEASLPAILRIFFLSYPIVTNVAFEGESSIKLGHVVSCHMNAFSLVGCTPFGGSISLLRVRGFYIILPRGGCFYHVWLTEA